MLHGSQSTGPRERAGRRRILWRRISKLTRDESSKLNVRNILGPTYYKSHSTISAARKYNNVACIKSDCWEDYHHTRRDMVIHAVLKHHKKAARGHIPETDAIPFLSAGGCPHSEPSSWRGQPQDRMHTGSLAGSRSFGR
jgi:hypothetical protein